MAGTDWYLSLRDGIEAPTAWAQLRTALGSPAVDDPLWLNWAKTNALDYLNLGPRLSHLEEVYHRDGQPLPNWWKHLRAFYQHKSEGSQSLRQH